MCQQKESKCKNRENNDAQLFNMHKYPTSTNVSNTAQKILAYNWCGSDISCIQIYKSGFTLFRCKSKL